MKNRRSIRLKNYDYSQAGLYFVTICVQDMRCLFGSIINGKMRLNENGKIINEEWQNLAIKYGHTKSHEYIIMPNHFHAIIEIIDAPVRAGSARPLHCTTHPLNCAINPINMPINPTNDTIRPLNLPQTFAIDSINHIEIGNANNCADGNVLECVGDSGGVGGLGLGGADDSGQADPAPTAAPVVNTATVGNIVGYFKYQTTKKIDLPVKLWQRNYYEHIIRDKQSYQNISKYIVNNPINWQKDKFYGNFKHR